MDSSLLLSMLSLIGVRLPALIAITIGLVWVVTAPRSNVRTGALAGLALLAVASLGSLVLSVLPIWLVQSGDFGSISRLSALLGIGHFGLGLLDAFGLVLVIWALVRLLRQQATPSR
ncbi:hypothetical protein [Stenotrophomonas sp. 24(2023)]|uniref:hypothetical protein n=1 Tax=Stenotrophomonas sp. 24(2023) TaxID=3068324 RepID=UPI0027DEF48C|nr:hypothetical protein [Stenotrophomonas sp. 24(2023)]WMJ70920.1 hypothetical protein Q9R17_07430 [Stenotrophomonas sp. 24(2023)]